MSDILKKPVHPVLFTKTPIEHTQKKVHHPYERLANEKQPLPKEPEPENPNVLLKLDLGTANTSFLKQEGIWQQILTYLYIRKPQELSDGQRYRFRLAKIIESGAKVWVADEFLAVLDRTTANTRFLKQERIKRRLKVFHDSIPPLAADKVPPCSTCVAVCCSSYIVPILKEEYESGIYGEFAVKITASALKALKTQHNLPFKWASEGNEDTYVLEGEVGMPCPFLGSDRRCTIYDSRPRTCRVYTCVGDSRVTDDMRSGKVDPIFASITLK